MYVYVAINSLFNAKPNAYFAKRQWHNCTYLADICALLSSSEWYLGFLGQIKTQKTKILGWNRQ